MKLIWCDLETTGLNPATDHILEVAVGVTDLRHPFDVETVDGFVLALPCARESLSPFILDMHTKNHLLDECASSTTTLAEVEKRLLALVPEVADREDQSTLAGSSVHFDLGFLRTKLPRVAKRLSHRVYDVSAVKLFCRSLGMPKLPRAEAHRARDDVRESIDHARRCAEWIYSP